MTAMQLVLDDRDAFVRVTATRQWRRIIVSGLLFGAVVWLLGVALFWTAESRFVFMTGLSRRYTAPLDPAVFKAHTFVSTNGLRLNGVVLTHESPRDRYWILFCPPAGASTLLPRVQHQLKQLSVLGYNVMAFDYRGFGDSPGVPTEEGLYADAAAAHAYLARHFGAPASRIILAGRSLGAAVAIDLATRVEAGGLLLFAPIDSVPQAAARFYPFLPAQLLAQYRFDAARKAGDISLPLVIFFARGDQYMPPDDARSFAQKFRGRKLIVETGGGHHHAGFIHIAELNRAMTAFWPYPTTVVSDQK